VVKINDPAEPNSVSTKGDHLVTISAGPAFESQREEASSFVETLASIPNVFPLVASEAVKLKNLGPIGDRIAEILEVLKPPEVRAMLEAKKQGQQDPDGAAKELVQAKAELQQLQQVAEQMKQALETDAAKQQATVEKAKIDNETKLRVAQMAEETKLKIAQLSNVVKPAAEQESESVEAEFQRRFDAWLAERQHEHEMELERMKAEHAAEMADRQHEHALESGEQQVVGKLAVENSKPKPVAKGGSE
jgi:hypothetical protein